MQLLNIFHVLIAIAMVAFILVQRGPGATAGAAFGSGASGTVFGSRGAGSFLSRSTWVLAAAFCLISLAMAVWVSRNIGAPETDLGVIGSATPTEQVEIPPMMEDLSTDVPSLDQDIDQNLDMSSGTEIMAPDSDVPVMEIPALEPADEESGAGAEGDDLPGN